METELLPCARKFGLRLVCYNPLACVQFSEVEPLIDPCSSGGLFAGKIQKVDDEPADGRFNTQTRMGQMYRARYLNEGYVKALDVLNAVAVSINCTGGSRQTDTF